MFLHDSGEEYNNVSRQDASKMNVKAFAAHGPVPSSSSPAPGQVASQPQPAATQPETQTSAAQSQPMTRHFSQEQAPSRSESVDSSALPSSASWATRNAHSESRRSSKALSESAPSPVAASVNLPAKEDGPSLASEPPAEIEPVELDPDIPPHLCQRLFSGKPHPLDQAMKTVLRSSFKFTFDRSMYSEDALKEIDAYPPLFDANGGLVRYRMEKEKEKERLKREEDERNALNTAEEDENPASGSLQLGGEPETQERPSDMGGQSGHDRNAVRPPYPISASSNTLPFGVSSIFSNQPSSLPFNNPGLSQQQQQLFLLQRGNNTLQSPLMNQQQQGFGSNTSQHHHQQSNPFQAQNQGLAISSHSRQASRYTFANESLSAAAASNSTNNAQMMAQQSTMMSANQSKMFQSQSALHSNQHNHFYSGVQGPPPGLKSSGTPPISGGGMFGQGYGFTTPVGGSIGLGRANAGNKNGNEELMRELLRGRNGAMNGQGPDVGKREFEFPSVKPPKTSSASSASSLLNSLYGSQFGAYSAYQDHSLQKQKKKGKKHRHANTSSSGGGGIVDLADPSILQARMHHGGVGQGQGQFAPQGQGVYNSNSMMYGAGYGSRY
jgi:CCR4-NOT transcription complex subunit 4